MNSSRTQSRVCTNSSVVRHKPDVNAGDKPLFNVPQQFTIWHTPALVEKSRKKFIRLSVTTFVVVSASRLDVYVCGRKELATHQTSHSKSLSQRRLPQREPFHHEITLGSSTDIVRLHDDANAYPAPTMVGLFREFCFGHSVKK